MSVPLAPSAGGDLGAVGVAQYHPDLGAVAVAEASVRYSMEPLAPSRPVTTVTSVRWARPVAYSQTGRWIPA